MKVSMIYMASGFGKRYGTNKLITEFRGEPLYLHGLLSLQIVRKNGKDQLSADPHQPV